MQRFQYLKNPLVVLGVSFLCLSLTTPALAMESDEETPHSSSPKATRPRYPNRSLIKAAEEGNPNAQFYLAAMYDFGEGVEEDPETAAFWYQRAAEQGDVIAQFNLGVICEMRGLSYRAEAITWYKMAAEQGEPQAQFNLALIYETSEDPKNLVKAFELYRKAAKKGLLAAQCNLGAMYEKGVGTLMNEAKAVRCYRKAAHRGDSISQFNLARMYHLGIGTKINKAKAEEWYKKADEQGNAYAKFILKMMHPMEGSQQSIEQEHIPASLKGLFEPPLPEIKEEQPVAVKGASESSQKDSISPKPSPPRRVHVRQPRV